MADIEKAREILRTRLREMDHRLVQIEQQKKGKGSLAGMQLERLQAREAATLADRAFVAQLAELLDA